MGTCIFHISFSSIGTINSGRIIYMYSSHLAKDIHKITEMAALSSRKSSVNAIKMRNFVLAFRKRCMRAVGAAYLSNIPSVMYLMTVSLVVQSSNLMV